jgi:hypothetical protein
MKKQTITLKVNTIKNRKRQLWAVNPITQVIADKTKYTRKCKHKKCFSE